MIENELCEWKIQQESEWSDYGYTAYFKSTCGKKIEAFTFKLEFPELRLDASGSLNGVLSTEKMIEDFKYCPYCSKNSQYIKDFILEYDNSDRFSNYIFKFRRELIFFSFYDYTINKLEKLCECFESDPNNEGKIFDSNKAYASIKHPYMFINPRWS